MRTELLRNRFALCFAFVFVIGFSSCKKSPAPDTSGNNGGTPGVPATGTRTQLTLDSLYLYAKQIYFWNDVLPDYSVFNPRQYSSKSATLDNLNDELFAYTQLKINPATGKAYEYYPDGAPKYSYIQDLTTANPSASSSLNSANVDTEGNGYDIGIRPVFYLSNNSDAYALFVTAVYPGSPAAAAGVKRGWLITSINGRAAGASYTNENSWVTSALNSSSVTISGTDFNSKVPFTLTLNKASYKSSPVYASTVIARSGKKIGYLAFARFSVLSNQSGPSDSNLDPVFSSFSSQGVTDLVIDLRYNGGGYVSTAEYLANLVAPSSVSGKAMYSEYYNTTMQTGKATILSNQPQVDVNGKVIFQNGKMLTNADVDYSIAGNSFSFSKKGSLSGISNVVFIVSRNTASASELLINSLKPYMNVKLVGDTTYGKPVGFFPVTIENRYEVFMSLFETRNSAGQGGYYTGMVPDVLSQYDDPTYVFGDPRDNYLSLALNVLAPGSTTQGTAMSIGDRPVQKESFSNSQIKKVNPNSEFTGMIERRHTRKK